MVLKCVYFLSVYVISKIMLFLSLRRWRTIKKKLKIWDLQRQHLTFLLVEVQKNLDIDFIVCTDIYKCWCWYWCSSEKGNSAQIVKDCNYLPLTALSHSLKALENTTVLRKEGSYTALVYPIADRQLLWVISDTKDDTLGQAWSAVHTETPRGSWVTQKPLTPVEVWLFMALFR